MWGGSRKSEIRPFQSPLFASYMQYIYAMIGPKSETIRKMITRKMGTSNPSVLPTDSIKLDFMLRIMAKLYLVLCWVCC